MAARGNANSFPLPWQDLLVQLQDRERVASMGMGVSLPRAGVELANVVSFLLKTAGSDQDEKVSARFIHQATVRRNVVVDLIEEMQRRGHSAYKHVDMEAVRERAEALPVDDVPHEIIRQLPFDGAHDKMQPNKNATPVSGEGSLDQVRKNLDVLRYNAVVNEKSSLDEGDEPAQVRACVENTVRKLNQAVDAPDECIEEEVAAELGNDHGQCADTGTTERDGVKTGNIMVDQFEPFLLWDSFCFLYDRTIVASLIRLLLHVRHDTEGQRMRLG